jgi:hypothetical protein
MHPNIKDCDIATGLSELDLKVKFGSIGTSATTSTRRSYNSHTRVASNATYMPSYSKIRVKLQAVSSLHLQDDTALQT